MVDSQNYSNALERLREILSKVNRNADIFISKDYLILKELSKDALIPLRELGKKIGIFSPSAVSRRIKKLRSDGVCNSSTNINFKKVGFEFITVTFIRAKYSPDYKEKVAEKIQLIRGILSLYFLLGDIDFVAVTISKSKEDYERVLDELTKIPEIERTDSRTVLKLYKENDISSIL